MAPASGSSGSSTSASSSSSFTSGLKAEIDIYRDTPVRLLGYTNEVGESFRALVPVNVVRLSYLVAAGYGVADTIDKTRRAEAKGGFANEAEKKKQLAFAAADTLIWQGLASVAIPGFTINRACALSLFLLTKYSRLSPVARKWTTVGVGLGSIPFIVKPIDHSVDFMLDNSLRMFAPR